MDKSKDINKVSAWIHTGIVTGMMICFCISLVQLGERVNPAWQGGYLITLSILASLEAQFSQRRLLNQDISTRVLIYRLAECGILIIGLRLVLYFLRGFGSFSKDLSLWREDFLIHFFSGEFLYSLIVVGTVWGLSTFFSNQLFQLEGDEEILILEQENQTGLVRRSVRDTLVYSILFIGVLMTGITSALYFQQRSQSGAGAARIGMIHLVIFFLLGLALLSLTQFSILRVRWVMDRFPFKSSLAIRWSVYSIGMIALIAFVSMLLPTNYSGNFLDFLNTLLSLLLWVIWAIVVVLTFPFLYIYSWIAKLFGKGDFEAGLPAQEFLPKSPEQVQAVGGWAEWIKDLVFWLVFLGVVLFSIIYYIRQNQVVMARLRKVRWFYWIRNFFTQFLQGMRGVKKKIQEVIEIQTKKLQERRQKGKKQALGYFSLRKLSPRQKVIFYYLAMVRRGGEVGLSRRPAQTPDEYAQRLINQIPDLDVDIQQMTREFNEARYSEHPIVADHATLIQKTWDRIRANFRRIKNEHL